MKIFSKEESETLTVLAYEIVRDFPIWTYYLYIVTELENYYEDPNLSRFNEAIEKYRQETGDIEHLQTVHQKTVGEVTKKLLQIFKEKYPESNFALNTNKK